MTRTISKSMAGLLEDLKLNNKTYVTLDELTDLARRHHVSTEPAMIASRLKKNGGCCRLSCEVFGNLHLQRWPVHIQKMTP